MIINDKLSNAIASLPDEAIRGYVSRLVELIDDTLSKECKPGRVSDPLPNLMVSELDDESVLIEWIFRNCRIGFSVYPNVEESSYYLISWDCRGTQYYAESREIGNDIESAVDNAVGFVLEYMQCDCEIQREHNI